MKIKIAIVGIVFLAVYAQAEPLLRHSIAANLGAVIPLREIDLTDQGGGKSDAGKDGTSFGFQYLYHYDRGALGAEFNYSNSGEVHSQTLVPGQSTNTSYN